MPPKKIPLREIERSITINCAIDYKSSKALQLVKWQGQGVNNHSIGRMIFMYLALNSRYSQEEICDYLNMVESDFVEKAALLDEYYAVGRQMFESVGTNATYLETREAYLIFYRKLVLAQNYLRYRFGD